MEKDREKALSNSSTDWFTSQSTDISIKHKLLGLKSVLERINKYENKIKEMQEALNIIVKKNIYLNKKVTKPSKNRLNLEDDNTEEITEDDLLLNDCENDDEEEENDDTTEEAYEPVKVYELINIWQ